MEENIKHYSNGEITVVWEAAKCVHSGICAKTLPNVFKPKEKPWIQTGNASSAEIINTVAKCPSGALCMLDK
ncbi:MAG: (4Fe-4S)-binding protein [Bacteroidia bacterium]